jgi:hypothetical protein
LNKEKGYREGSLPLLIRKEEGGDDPKNEKGVGSPTIDPKQTKAMQK